MELMEQQRKRSRAANFTTEEKRVCLELANKYKHIIENKKTDATSKEEKDRTWNKIANEFNTLCPAMINRTSSNLKNFFDNQKRSARKQAAENRMERIRTGGGPSAEKNDPLIDMTLDIINKKTVSGLTSRFDDDATIELMDEVEKTEQILGLGRRPADVEKENRPSPVYEAEHLSSDPPDNSSDQPIINKSTESVKRTTERMPSISTTKTGKTPKWAARRRPLGNASLNLAKTYEDLAALKTDMTQLQLQLLQRQQTEEVKKNETEAEKCNLETQALLAQIEKNKEKTLYWRQKREHELIKFQIEKETMIVTLQIKQKELNKLLNE